ncbi:hypothetical protein AKJ16_DCAP23513 [Drosera capensis]
MRTIMRTSESSLSIVPNRDTTSYLTLPIKGIARYVDVVVVVIASSELGRGLSESLEGTFLRPRHCKAKI